MTFDSIEGTASALSNFTITGGNAYDGGGIYCSSSAPTIKDNIITGNVSDTYGGGISCNYSSPIIMNNTITSNSAIYGGGISFDRYTSSVIKGNNIHGNSAEEGGGIGCFTFSSPTITNNTIVGNSASTNGGGIYCYYVSAPNVTNTIIWDNTASTDPNISVYFSDPYFNYCDVMGSWKGEGNIDDDPLFCDAENGDFTVQSDSPVLGAGQDGTDMGAYGVGCEEEIECDLGDVNCDGELNVLDIVLAVNMVLAGEYDEVADVNGDGQLNILDLVTLVNWVLFGNDGACIDIDGNVYETVLIGEQEWMAENLKVAHYQNSDDIPYIYNDPQYGAYINYSNNADNVAVYGRLYNWFAVNDERGLCPDNWHVPSDDEFKSLEMYLGMSESEANGEGLRGTDEGGKLKKEGNEHWNSPNTGATNETGFTALPGGNRRYETYTNQEIFSGLNRYGFFWSSSEVYTVNAWYRVLSYDYSESNRYHLSKANAFSVRCVKD